MVLLKTALSRCASSSALVRSHTTMASRVQLLQLRANVLQKHQTPRRFFSSLPPDEKAGVARPESIKFAIFCIPAVLYLAYVLQFGPSEEEIEAKVKKYRAKDIREGEETVDYQKNIIRQAIFAPEKLDSTVDQLLQGGRYGYDVKDKKHLYEAQQKAELAAKLETDKKGVVVEVEEVVEEEPKKKKKKKKKQAAKSEGEGREEDVEAKKESSGFWGFLGLGSKKKQGVEGEQ